MLLAIDAGNTNVVFALVDGREIKTRWRIATDARRTGDEYAVWLHQLLELEGYSRSDVTAAIIGTVVPRATHNLEVLASKYFHVEPLIAGEGKAAWPIALDVDEPQNVGADRALNVIAAHEKYPGRSDRHRLRNRHDLRRRRLHRRLQGRDHRAGDQPVDRRARQRGRQASAHRDRGSRGPIGHRPDHREPDADRHLLGLCGDDGRIGRPAKARDRATREGACDRGASSLVRRANRPVRRR